MLVSEDLPFLVTHAKATFYYSFEESIHFKKCEFFMIQYQDLVKVLERFHRGLLGPSSLLSLTHVHQTAPAFLCFPPL